MPINRSDLNQSGNQVKNFRVHNLPIVDESTLTPSVGGMRTLTPTSDRYFGGLQWSDGTSWFPIYPPYQTQLAGGPTLPDDGGIQAVVVESFGGGSGGVVSLPNVSITGAYFDGATRETTFLSTARAFSITGKATAAGIDFNGTSGVALNVTALSVVPGDIALSGAAGASFIQSNGSGVGVSVAKGSIPLSGFGNPAAAISMAGQRLNGLQLIPVTADEAASKDYVDNKTAGIAPNTPVRVATAAALTPAYTAAGSPATLTAQTPYAALTIDGVAVANGDRVLVKNESGASEKYNGVYTVTAAGSAGAPWVLDRAAEENSDAEVNTGDEFFVVSGTVNAATTWALQTPEPITLGTTALTFVQTSGNQSYSAGNGLVQVGTVFHAVRSSAYTVNGVVYADTTNGLTFTDAGGEYKVLRCAAGQNYPSFGAVDLATAMVTGTLTVGKGGTGRSSWTTGDLVYASSPSNIAPLAAAAAGNVLLSGATPSWGKVNLSSHVSSQLPVANGGTGRATLTSGAVLYGLGTTEVGMAAVGGAGYVCVSSGAVPQFVPISGDVNVTSAGLATIQPGAVQFAKIQSVNSGSVAYRKTAGAGPLEAQTLAQLGADLVSGGHVPRSIELVGDVTSPVTTSATVTTTIANLALSKLATGPARSVVGVAGGAGAHTDISSAGPDTVLRVNTANSAVEFGAINLASSNAVAGTLPTTRGGTGVSNAGLTFPSVTSAGVGFVAKTLLAGGTVYTSSNPFGTYLVAPVLIDSSGNVIGADIVTSAGSVTVTFGQVTSQAHTLLIIGTNQTIPLAP